MGTRLGVKASPSVAWGRKRAFLTLLCGLMVSASAAGRAQTPRAPTPSSQVDLQTTDDWNRRLQELVRSSGSTPMVVPGEYRIGPEDLVEISIFEAPEMNRSARVSAGGEISLPLLGSVRAAGLTPRELEFVLQELLRRTYMKDPHVGVYVREIVSHPVSVFGAVEKPGVYQIRGSKTLLEVLSMAEGLADDAGDTVIVMRGASFLEVPPSLEDNPSSAEGSGSVPPGLTLTPSPAPNQEQSIEVNLKSLLESGDPSYNVPVYPGDIVKVTRAGIVYVVGEVKKPGGFVLKSNENISVLQAVALGEGLTRTAARSKARIIRTDEKTGGRTEIPIDLGRILAGKESDPMLQPKDIVFIPNSATRSALYRGGEAAISVVSGVIIWRR